MKFRQILPVFLVACTATYVQAQVKVGANPGTISTNAVLDVEGSSGNHSVILQNGNMGVNTTQPGSTLTSAGSLAANYMNVTSATYTMAVTDHFVSYDGSGAGTITLPPALAVGSGNFKGRLYTIKNTTASQILTVAATGSETIDGVTSLTVASEYAVQVISTGATTGKTWEVVSLSPTATKPALGSSTVYTVIATAPVNVDPGANTYSNYNVDLGMDKTITIPANTNALVSVIYSIPMGTDRTVFQSSVPNGYLGVRFLKNNAEQSSASRLFSIPWIPNGGTAGFGETITSSVIGIFSELINASASPTTIIYEPKGVIDQNVRPGTTNALYRFNMWAASGDNRGWGRASMIITVTYF